MMKLKNLASALLQKRPLQRVKATAIPDNMDESIKAYDVTDYAFDIDLSRLDVVHWAPAWLTRAERLMIYTLIFCLRPLRYLEIGTLRGGSALIAAAAMDALGPAGRIICIDPKPQISPEHWMIIEHRAILLKGASPGILSKAHQAAEGSFDFVFIDGDHSYEGVKRDANGVLPYVTHNAYLLFHDGFYPDVARAIDEFVGSNLHRVIDCGMVTREVIHASESGVDVTWGGLRLVRFQGK